MKDFQTFRVVFSLGSVGGAQSHGAIIVGRDLTVMQASPSIKQLSTIMNIFNVSSKAFFVSKILPA